MNEQSGIDILCDAAGSDLLLASFFTPSSPASEQVAKRLKRSEEEASPPPSVSSSSSNHICHICKRVYERADHLTRHLRSHENARPYQCTRCPKAFNRADLLTRHEATHDRNTNKGRPFIRRSDRATQACQNCASSKAKCDDQKPCGRCKAKHLNCQPSTRRTQVFKTAGQSQTATSPSGSVCDTVASEMPSYVPENQPPVQYDLDGPSFVMNNAVVHDDSLIDPALQDMSYFNPTYFNPTDNFFQDMEFPMSWDMNFDAFSIPHVEIHGPSPASHSSVNSTKPTPQSAIRDPSRGHAAFKRSPWLWEPKQEEDYVSTQKEGLDIDEDTIAQSPAFGRLVVKPARKLRLDSAQRDRVFALVLDQNKDPRKTPSFPTLDLLNYLLQAHFVHDEYQYDNWIHAASFDPENTLPELLASVISSGANYVAVPAIWQFGLAIHEVARLGISNLFESGNTFTRDLRALQAFMLMLDVGMWCGYKRKMEIAESFIQPLLTMLRRAGAFSTSTDSPCLVPLESDSDEALELKWQQFIRRESYKRLIIHLFHHDAQTSVSLQKNHLISYSELSFSLPASRDLWRAPSAEAWRQACLRKVAVQTQLPRVSEVMHSIHVLDGFEEVVDLELCYSAVLHGFWGQIAAYREAIRLYPDAGNSKKNATHRLWLKSQHQELYQDMCEFSTILYTSRKASPTLAIILELFMMILHVSLDHLQKFAGKAGEEESRRAAISLEEGWANASEARYAIWHAGQVLHNARRLPPAALRGFNAISVYLASLTLWVYGLLSSSPSNKAQSNDDLQANSDDPNSRLVLMDQDESRDTKAFLQLDKGIPALTVSGDPRAGVESLSNPGMILTIARNVFRENFPVRTEPLPPLVESLGNLLKDLGSGVAGRPSRVASRVASRAVSEDRH